MTKQTNILASIRKKLVVSWSLFPLIVSMYLSLGVTISLAIILILKFLPFKYFSEATLSFLERDLFLTLIITFVYDFVLITWISKRFSLKKILRTIFHAEPLILIPNYIWTYSLFLLTLLLCSALLRIWIASAFFGCLLIWSMFSSIALFFSWTFRPFLMFDYPSFMSHLNIIEEKLKQNQKIGKNDRLLIQNLEDHLEGWKDIVLTKSKATRIAKLQKRFLRLFFANLGLVIIGFSLLTWTLQRLGLAELVSLNGQEINDFFTYLYFSIMTVFTVGYGDVIPTGSPMKIFATVEILTGVFLIVVLILSFTSITRYAMEEAHEEINSHYFEIKKKLDSLTKLSKQG